MRKNRLRGVERWGMLNRNCVRLRLGAIAMETAERMNSNFPGTEINYRGYSLMRKITPQGSKDDFVFDSVRTRAPVVDLVTDQGVVDNFCGSLAGHCPVQLVLDGFIKG